MTAKIRAIVKRLHESSERYPDVRGKPMRLVEQDVFNELLYETGLAVDPKAREEAISLLEQYAHSPGAMYQFPSSEQARSLAIAAEIEVWKGPNGANPLFSDKLPRRNAILGAELLRKGWSP